MKIVRVYGIQVLCLVFLLLAAAWFFPIGSSGNAGHRGECEPYRSGWQVSVGDGMQRMDWAQDAQLPEYLAMRGVSQMTLERTVEEPDTVGFFAFEQQVYVCLDGEEIQHFAPERPRYSKTPGNGWQFIELTGEDVGRQLSIRLVQCYGDGRVKIPVLYHGTKEGIMLHYLAEKIPMFLLSMLGVTVGLILLLIWCVAGEKIQLGRGLPWLALFAVFIGAWSAIEANIYSFFFENLMLISRLSYMCLKLAVAPFILFVNITFHSGESKLLRTLTALSLAEFWVTGFLQLFGILDYADTLFLTHGILTISSAYIIVTAIPKLVLHRQEWKTVTDQRIAYVVHSIFIIVVAVTSLMDLFGYYFTNNPDVAHYSRFGYFGYILAVAIALLLDYMNLVVMGKQAEVIKKEASIDAMTKLRNRAEFERDMGRFTAKSSRKMGVIMFDLNNLKYVNDTYGHELGDAYIISGSRVIYESFEKCGRIYRIGGDEFCCIAKSLTEEGFAARSREMEQRIADFYMEGADGARITMAIASGYAAFDPEQDSDLKETMKRADVRMYERKKQLKAQKKSAQN